MLNEKLNKIHFFITFLAFNGTFFPMHILGVGGHMRRIYNPMQYEFLKDFQGMNEFISISAFVLGFTQLLFLFNVLHSLMRGKKAADNPWQSNTLEWTAIYPIPHGNFAALPTVYRGPYEYSAPEVEEDWLPQTRKLATTSVSGNGHH